MATGPGLDRPLYAPPDYIAGDGPGPYTMVRTARFYQDQMEPEPIFHYQDRGPHRGYKVGNCNWKDSSTISWRFFVLGLKAIH